MRMIDADKLYPDCMTKNGTLAISQNQIANAKTIKPLTGEWIAITSCIDNDIHIVCSNCKEEFIGKSTLEEWKKEYLFCHRCGSDMRGNKE